MKEGRALYELCALNNHVMQIYKHKADQRLFLLGIWIRGYWLRTGKQLERPKTWHFINGDNPLPHFWNGKVFPA